MVGSGITSPTANLWRKYLGYILDFYLVSIRVTSSFRHSIKLTMLLKMTKKEALIQELNSIPLEKDANIVCNGNDMYCKVCLQNGRLSKVRHVKKRGFVCYHCNEVRFLHTPTCLGSKIIH